MKSVIWKFPLNTNNIQEIEMPEGSCILSLQVQNEIPCLWALVIDIEAKKEKIKIRTIGTGHPFTDDNLIILGFIGTYQLENKGLVFHVFKVS